MGTKYKAADIDEVPEDGDRVIVEIKGHEIAVFNLNNSYHAILNYCIHQGGPLCEGSLVGQIKVDDNAEWDYVNEGEVITCPWHGWQFKIKTGKHIGSEQYSVPTFEVVQEEEELFVVM